MLLNLDNVGFYVLLKLQSGTYLLVIYELFSSKLKIKDTSHQSIILQLLQKNNHGEISRIEYLNNVTLKNQPV